MEIISRAAAKASGSQFFFTGRPCRRGHVAQRYVAQGLCVECSNLAAKQRRERDPEGTRLSLKEWRQRNPDRLRLHNDKWKHENSEKWRAYTKRYREENRERITARTLAWREANRERWDKAARQWQAANKDKLTVVRRNRRARVKNAEGSHTLAEIRELLEKQRGKCIACGKRLGPGFHADHVVPLLLGGSNDIGNIQLLCKSCNSSKGAKPPMEWMRKRGLLL